MYTCIEIYYVFLKKKTIKNSEKIFRKINSLKTISEGTRILRWYLSGWSGIIYTIQKKSYVKNNLKFNLNYLIKTFIFTFFIIFYYCHHLFV